LDKYFFDDSHFFNFFQLDLGKVAIIHRNIYPNMAINQIYEIQIFNQSPIFLAQHLKPNIKIWEKKKKKKPIFFPHFW